MKRQEFIDRLNEDLMSEYVPGGDIPRFPTKTDAEEAFLQDLDLEETQPERYRARVDPADFLGLPDVAEALAPLLEQTQNHTHDVRSALDTNRARAAASR